MATTLVLSDIHGNLAALEAVLAEPHDQIICLGDTVGRGVQASACLSRLREERAQIILGNHEFAILQRTDAVDRYLADDECLHHRDDVGSRARLSRVDLDHLCGLPRWLRVDNELGACLCVHGTPRSLFGRGIGADPAAWRNVLATNVPVNVVFAGHTHVPYHIVADGTRIVNPGSVGLPMDGDPRPAFAEISGAVVRTRRVEYPIERTIAAIEQAGLSDVDMQLLISWVRTGCRLRRPHSAIAAHCTERGDQQTAALA